MKQYKIYLDMCSYNRPFDMQSQVKQDTFDYTEWHEQLWNNKTIEQIHDMAREHEKMSSN